ncbi:MAG: PcfB family protein [Clostridiales bacterium]|nr:PcfB family protein [Clostridiales bacterium]
MQEEIIDKSINVAVRIVNLTLGEILKGLEAIIAGFEKNRQVSTPDGPVKLKQGRQTLRQLHRHNEGLANIELTNPNLRELNKTMKDRDIAFSCVKDGKGKYTLFFKGKNENEMTNAFKRYAEKMVAQADKKAGKTAKREEKKSIRQELREAKAAAKSLELGRDKVKTRSRGALSR